MSLSDRNSWQQPRPFGVGLLAALAVTALSALPAGAAPLLSFQPAAGVTEAVPPLPSPATFPVQLVVDDDAAEGSVGVVGQAARQFLWFNRFTPGEPVVLEEVWVLFPANAGVNVGDAVQLAVYEDADGNPANGATLLSSVAETVQAADGNTFSVYPLAAPVSFGGSGDLLIGVVPRFIQSGVTPPTNPAAIDTTASQTRSWIAVWSGDPPDPPVLVPPPDQQISTIDGFLPGNWMIRGFGRRADSVAIPALGPAGLALLATALLLAALVFLRRAQPVRSEAHGPADR
ncbi:MAG TPA: hypothetical protein VF017_16775 [Thermoanaerobaculia bacterium]|nr:hypothetical protein [Thermoanaerobaculia bacterium]